MAEKSALGLGPLRETIIEVEGGERNRRRRRRRRRKKKILIVHRRKLDIARKQINWIGGTWFVRFFFNICCLHTFMLILFFLALHRCIRGSQILRQYFPSKREGGCIRLEPPPVSPARPDGDNEQDASGTGNVDNLPMPTAGYRRKTLNILRRT